MSAVPDPATGATVYAEVVLPLATARVYTYQVPEALVPEARPGLRVEVQFGRKKRYTGVIYLLHQRTPGHRTKPILSVIDLEPIVTEQQLQLWAWVADYYCCTLGEVMHAALPANFKLSSETRITLGPLFHDDYTQLDDKEYLIAEALTIQHELSLDEVQGILQQKTIYPVIRRLLDQKIIYLKEDLQEKYQPKVVSCVRLTPAYAEDQAKLAAAFDRIERSEHQTNVLLEYIQLARQQPYVRRADLTKRTGADYGAIQALVKKEIFETYDREISRLAGYEEDTIAAAQLAEQQTRALAEIRGHFAEKKTVLLHGVTGSGKTRVYTELMQETIAAGGQVLYLLPEIALTAQIVGRLQRVLGDEVAIYHSRMSNNERVELWKQIMAGKKAVVGPRSALFLPFQNLRLVIVDEEHDPSYKQREPNPRYNGRDVAVFLGHQFGADVLLGTATPSLESHHNALTGKYARVTMPERFGGIQLPEVVLANVREEMQQRKLQSHFTSTLIEELKSCLGRGEQAILFQNRRGYAPTYRCQTCDWHSECVNCDISLTYHKFHNRLKCHYCGYTAGLPEICPACGNHQLKLQGYGTEKIEDELKIYLPDAKIGRMDLDTVRGKTGLARIINEFEMGDLDILVGTQMVTKGLDFERVGVVGVINADQLLQFPDFRAGERGFHLITQVSGRAGRKHRRGRVVIQAMNPGHPVLMEILNEDMPGFYARELAERKAYFYPPFARLIQVQLRHKKPQSLETATKIFDLWLREALGAWVHGPAAPYVGRVRNYYLMDFLVKIDRDPVKLRHAKEVLRTAADKLLAEPGLSSTRVVIDVDP